MQTRHRDLFTTVRTEGAILPADLLARIAAGSGLEGLRPEDYHLSGEKLNEAISRAWNRLQGAWANLQSALAKLPDTDPATSVTREKWMLPLFDALSYGRLPVQKSALELGGKSYPVSHAWQNVPVHFVGWNVDLDRRTENVAGAARSSPHSLVQELLNRADDRLWGFVSNGRRLRVLRDNVSLTRQSFVEFDLEAMLAGEVYADFALLWLVSHQSRVEGERPEQCWLERWSRTAHEQGARALDQLRVGVEEAIRALGRGLLAHRDNAELREKLRLGTTPTTNPQSPAPGLSTQDFYRQILRLVYRLLFLFVAEDRDLLLDPAADAAARDRYLRFYSTARLRKLAARRHTGRHADLYESLRLVMQKLGDRVSTRRDSHLPGTPKREPSPGCPELALPALGSFLWSPHALSDLENCRLANADLLDAVRALAYTIDGQILRPVDYKNLGSEELGSVYESLLELHPELNVPAATFELRSAAGHERKTTGSYYTPTSLINCLLDSALEPVLAEAAARPTKAEAETAVLNLKVCDPACGSGHFLIAAAHRIARRLAALRTGDEEPAPTAVRHALREVVGRSIYGVDLNPMAVELCKVGLWMEALEPGKPLSFLEHHIQCGNALLGATPALLAKGISDEAFTPIEGDDKKLCTSFKKQNRDERRGQKQLFADAWPWDRLGDFATGLARLDVMSDDTPAALRDKEDRYGELVRSADYLSGRFWADAWCAAFVWKKTREFDYAITEDVFRSIERNPHSAPPWLRAEVERLAKQYQFFHWHLAFPSVFRVPARSEEPENEHCGWSGGFDLMLGNPPWDKIQPEEQKFFATIRRDIAEAESARLRKDLIASLPENDPATDSKWKNHLRFIGGLSQLIKHTGVFSFASEGNLNTYRVFVELAAELLSQRGRAGLIVQSGLATDEAGKELFDHLLQGKRLQSFFDFENRAGYFPSVDSRFRFCLLTMLGNPSHDAATTFGWLLQSIDELSVPDRLVKMRAEDLLLFNPSSRTSPIFASARDLRISRTAYSAASHVYIDHNNRLGSIEFLGELFNLTRDSRLFESPTTEQKGDYLQLYEAKYFHQFDHRYAEAVGTRVEEVVSGQKQNPFFSVPTVKVVKRSEVERRLSRRAIDTNWLFGFRDIASATNERTVILSLLPKAAIGNSINLILGLAPRDAAFLCANANAMVFDYCCRQKVSGTHVNVWIFKQLPAVKFDRYGEESQWTGDGSLLAHWVLNRVIELVYTAWDLEPFARDCGYEGSPFRWDDERRFLLRCELDAAFFHLYGIERDDVDYILETFPIVKRKDVELHGEYRTKRFILEIFDELGAAIHTGRAYATRLDPPPADPRVAHPDRRAPTKREVERGLVVAYIQLLLKTSNAIMTRPALHTGLILMTDDDLRKRVLASERSSSAHPRSSRAIKSASLDQILDGMVQTGALETVPAAAEDAFRLGPSAANLANIPAEHRVRAEEALQAVRIVGDSQGLAAYQPQASYEELVIV